MKVIVAINSGSTSVKLSIFDYEKERMVSEAELPVSLKFKKKEDFPMAKEELLKIIGDYLQKHLKEDDEIVGFACRGGLIKVVKGGTYEVNETMIEELSTCKYGVHASNLSAVVGNELAKKYGVKAFIVDPVTSGQFSDEALISGVPGVERKCRYHALNAKAAARHVAQTHLKRKFEECSFVVVHCGGGTSVSAIKGGVAVDTNNALLGEGPFSAERAGTVPIEDVLNLAFSGKSIDELKIFFTKNCGFKGLLGTNNFKVIMDEVQKGNEEYVKVYKAFVYQIAKSIGAYATALKGKVDAIILTGGMARDEQFAKDLEEYVSYIAPFFVVPGSHEMEALCKGVCRVLKGEEPVQQYE
jgi:butyrate kinase